MATFTPVANLDQFSPTGVVNVASGIGNPVYAQVGPSQQINVGDVVYLSNDDTYGEIALPAITTPPYSTATTAQESLHDNLLGVSLSYRSVKNTSSGKKSDVIGIAPSGRVRMVVTTNSNDGTTTYGYTGSQAATPVGSFWGVAPQGTVASGGTGTNLTFKNEVALVAGAAQAIGRQALPKSANDQFVYVDLEGTLTTGGPQEIA